MSSVLSEAARRDVELERAWSELTAPGAPFEVAEATVRGVPVRTFVRAPETLGAFWEASAAFGERDYLVFGSERTTYTQARAATTAVSAWLSRHGVVQGDRVAIAMRNYPEWLLIYWACLSMGVTVVGMNAWWAPEEMELALAEVRPKALFADAERLERLASVTRAVRPPLTIAVRTPPADGAATWDEVISEPGAAPSADIGPDDEACIFFTSGTTGAAKGAQLTHRSCLNNMMTMGFIAQVQGLALSRALGVAVDFGAIARPVGLATTPLFHVTANNCLAHTMTASGGTLVLMYKWDAGEALRLIEAEGVTTLSGVPTMSRELLAHPDAPHRDLSTLTTLIGGGAQLTPDLVSAIHEHASAVQPSTGYGMTETSGIISAISGAYLVARPLSCGRPLPTFEVRVMDGDTVLPAGETGEICVRSAGVIKGYFNRPEATAESIVEGWLHTGDIGRIDKEGFIYLLDRKKDMVLRGGENVYCAEVETAVFRHPDVQEVCVFGVADERLGEEVGAAVVLRSGRNADAGTLRLHVAALIARHKVPRYIWILEEPLPRNAAGKFLRRELRDALDPGDAQ